MHNRNDFQDQKNDEIESASAEPRLAQPAHPRESLEIALPKLIQEREEVFHLIQLGRGAHHRRLDDKYTKLGEEIASLEKQIATLSSNNLYASYRPLPPSLFSSNHPRSLSTRFFNSSFSISHETAAALPISLVDIPSLSAEDDALPVLPSSKVEEANVESPSVVNRERMVDAEDSSRYPHRVFISHRGTQKKELAFPIMAIFSYFCGPEFAVFDEVTFELGEENRTVISKALWESTHCLALVSEDFFQSKWTVEEVEIFLKAIETEEGRDHRKIISFFTGLSPGDCKSLNEDQCCDKSGQPLAKEDVQHRQAIGKKLSGRNGRERVRTAGESIRNFILKHLPDLLMKKYLWHGNKPVLLPQFKNQVNPKLLAYVYDEALAYYQAVHGKVNGTNLGELIVKLRLQTSLKLRYEQQNQLERLFDERKTPIVDSFINLALIKETEHKQKEKGLGGSGTHVEEKEEDGYEKEKKWIDERIASHEALYAVREPIALNQLFGPKNDKKTPNKILILGRAGIGKSVLCQYLAVQWASDFECKEKEEEQKQSEIGNDLRQKFDAVFWVKLREVAAGSPRYNTVANLLHQFCLRGMNKPSVEELQVYLTCQYDKILFILDGYDEIIDSMGQENRAHLTDFLNEIVHYPHILVTSRPLAIDALGQSALKFDRKLENIGFTNENIENYVRYFMREAGKLDQAAPLLQFLKTHPSIWGIAHIPINLELLSWLGSQGDLVLKPGQAMTLSKLYQMIVDRVQDVYARKFSPPQTYLPEASLTPNAEGLSSSELVNEFLGYVAYEAMQHESLLIPKEQIKEALVKTLRKHHRPDNVHHQERLLKSATDKLGFLRATGEGGRSQWDQSHYFIHLSFQEFYAAKYIARILSHPIGSEEKGTLIQHIKREKYLPRYQLMLWMTAGLAYQQGKEEERKKKTEENFAALEQFWQAILSAPRDLIGFHHLVLVMHCLDECEADDRFPLHQALIDQQRGWFEVYIKRRHSSSDDMCYYKQEYCRELVRCLLVQNAMGVFHFLLKNLRKQKSTVLKVLIIKILVMKELGQLSNPPEPVITALVYALRKESEDIGYRIVEALSQFLNPSEVLFLALVEVVQDSASFVSLCACEIQMVGRFSNPSSEVIQALVDALQDKDETVKNHAIEALSLLASPEEPAIIALIDASKDENVSQRAFLALSQFSNLSETVIIRLLHDLLKTPSQGYSFLERKKIAKSLLYQLQNFHGSYDLIVSTLLHLLQGNDPDLKRNASELLSQLPNLNEKAIPVFLNMLQEKGEGCVKRNIIDALSQLPHPDGAIINAYLSALQDKEVSYSAAQALGQLSNPSEGVVIALSKALQNKVSPPIRCFSIKALDRFSNLNETIITILLNTFPNEELPYKEKAVLWESIIKKLSQLSNPDEPVIHAFSEALSSNPCNPRYFNSLKFEAVQAVLMLDRPSLSILLEPAINALVDLLEFAKKSKPKRRKFNFGGCYDEFTSLLSHLKTNHIRIVLDKLIERQLLAFYLLICFEQNYLLCIDDQHQQVIFSFNNKMHVLSLPPEILVCLEKEIWDFVKQERFRLDIILLDDKKIHLSNKLFMRVPSSDFRVPSPSASRSFIYSPPVFRLPALSPVDLRVEQAKNVCESDRKELSEDGRIQFLFAAHCLDKHNLNQAIEHYIKSLQGKQNLLSPEQKWHVYHNLACCYHVQGLFSQAEYYFRWALQQKPMANTYCSYSSLLMHQSRFLEAISLLGQAIARKNDSSLLVYSLAEKRLLDDYLEQEITEEKSLNINPALLAYYWLIRCYQGLNQPGSIQACLAQFTEFVEEEHSSLAYRLLLYTHQFLGNAEKVAACQIIITRLNAENVAEEKARLDVAAVSPERSLDDVAAIDKEQRAPPQLLLFQEAVSAVSTAASQSLPAAFFNKNNNLNKRKEPHPFSAYESQQDGQEDDIMMKEVINPGLGRMTVLESPESAEKRRRTDYHPEQTEQALPHGEEAEATSYPAARMSQAEKTSPLRRLAGSHTALFSNEKEALKTLLQRFSDGGCESEEMQSQLQLVLQSFQSKYPLNSNRMFLIIKHLLELESDKIELKWSQSLVENILSGHIPEGEKAKIQKKVANNEFYQIFFEVIAAGLGIPFFLSSNQHAHPLATRASQ
jgi:HEAT repeat protein/tetratricopeptide (TPR) repeat protein